MSTLRLGARRGPDFPAWLLIAGALFLALFLGLVTSVLPWLFTLLLVLLPLILLASIAYPQIGLLLAVMFIFEVVPGSLQPRMPLASIKLQAYDPILLYLSLVVLARAFVGNQNPLLSLGAIRWPLYYLLLCTVASLVYVHYFAPNSFSLADARVAVAWLVIPIAVLSIDTERNFRLFVRAMVAMALIIALYTTIQSLFNFQIMTGSRVEYLDKEENSDIVRSIAGGGIYIVIFALFLTINRVLERRVNWLLGLLTSLLLVSGIAVQFGRGVWAGAAVGLLISAALFRGLSGVVRVCAAGALAVALVMSAAAVFKPRLAEAVIERVTGFRAEVEFGGSFNWRLIENRAAIDKIIENPLMGAGLGGEYKQTVSLSGSFQNETHYIHNGYLYFPLKMGIFATFIPLSFIVAFVVTIRRGMAAHRVERPDPAFVAAVCGAFAVPVITSFTQPEWGDPRGIAAFAVLMAMALLYHRLGSPLASRGAAAA